MILHQLQHLQGHQAQLEVVQLGYCDDWHGGVGLGDAQEHYDVHELHDELELNDGLNDELGQNDVHGLNDGLGQNDVHDEVKNDVRMWYDEQMEQNDVLDDVNEGLNDVKRGDQNDGLRDGDHLGDLGLAQPHIT